MSCGVGRRHGLDLALLWLWRRLATVAPILPLAWEPTYAMGAALKRQKKKKKEKKRKEKKKNNNKKKTVRVITKPEQLFKLFTILFVLNQL